MTDSKLKDLILDLAIEFINVRPDDFDKYINKGLSSVGSFLEMDRAYLFAYDHERRLITNTHEWCAPGIEPQIKRLKDIPMEPYPEWIEPHLRGEVIQIPSVKEMPEGRLKESLKAQAIQSLVAVPLMKDTLCLGSVGFDSVRKERVLDRDYIFLIKILADIYANVISRKQIESSLKTSERKYKELVEGLPIGLYQRTPDPDGKFIMANQALADMLGYDKPDDLIGLSISSLCVDMRKRQQCSVQLGRTGAIREQEVQFRKRTGEPFWVSVSARTIFDSQGKVCCVEGSVQDISQRKKQEEEKQNLQAQLQQAQKMESIGRLAGGIAHDFNNLLVPILGYGELLLNMLADNDRACRYVTSIVEAGERAKDIIRQLLAFSRKQIIEIAPVDVNETITCFKKFLRHTLRENIEIVLDLDSTLPMIKADRRQLEQILLNLAVNAQDAMPAGGRLIIKTSRADSTTGFGQGFGQADLSSYVILSVRDTGMGMDQEMIEQIFEPFFTTKPKEKGTGLGLSTVYGIVKQHGGFLQVDTEPGRGSTFRIFLPSSREQAEKHTKTNENVPDGKGTGTILLLEDERDVGDFISRVLVEYGYHVIQASSPEEAFRKMDKFLGKVDLLLTDVIMPGMNGKEVYRVLKEKKPSLKVLYMSGYAPDIISLESDKDFLAKPFSIEQLITAVRHAMERAPVSQD